MTEAEWLACDHVHLLCEHVKDRLLGRKGILFAVACCRRIPHLHQDPDLVAAVNGAEAIADCPSLREELAPLQDRVFRRWAATQYRSGEAFTLSAVLACWDDRPGGAAYHVRDDAAAAATPSGQPIRSSLFLDLVHDIIGNPFRPVVVIPDWLTWNDGLIAGLAGTIYAEHAFDRLPILADALEDAGCTQRDILDHCRGAGQHVRGCWVLDLLLGKE
jgi:hypothetical protein